MTTNKNEAGNSLPQVFTFNSSDQQVRSVLINGEPYFVAKDVCDILQLTDTHMTVGRLDEDEKLTQVVFGSGQNRQMWLVNESGLYHLIFQSRKSEAKAFRKWVTSEVLPELRKTGKYEVNPYATNRALKEYGFITDRKFTAEDKLWTAERDDIFIKYVVSMYSPESSDQISSYRLTITVEPEYEDINKGKSVMAELSGAKYDGNDAGKVYNWVEKNYNNHNASIDVGCVRFTISAPSKYVRILNANKINSETGDIFN